MKSLGRKATKQKLAYELTSHLLNEVVVAAGELERSILQLRKAHDTLRNYISEHRIKSEDGIPYNLSHEGSVEALYAFSDVLSWSRTVVERLKTKPVDWRKFPDQGLIPAIKLKRLKSRCEDLFTQLKNGPVGQTNKFCAS